jgi:Hypervirulence associated proteins TUDOR domain
MPKTFQRGDHVEWNSEAGRVRGVIVKKVVSDVTVNGYVHHASKEEPQYFIKSDKTEHVAIHKGQAPDTHQGCEEVKASSGKKKGKIIDHDFIARGFMTIVMPMRTDCEEGNPPSLSREETSLHIASGSNPQHFDLAVSLRM